MWSSLQYRYTIDYDHFVLVWWSVAAWRCSPFIRWAEWTLRSRSLIQILSWILLLTALSQNLKFSSQNTWRFSNHNSALRCIDMKVLVLKIDISVDIYVAQQQPALLWKSQVALFDTQHRFCQSTVHKYFSPLLSVYPPMWFHKLYDRFRIYFCSSVFFCWAFVFSFLTFCCRVLKIRLSSVFER